MVKSPNKNGADSGDEFRDRVREEKQLLRESPANTRNQEESTALTTLENQGEGETSAREKRRVMIRLA